MTCRRLLALLAFVLAVTPAAGQDVPLTYGKVFEIDSRVLGETRTFFVHLPRSYGRGSQRYPVLYATDAETQFEHTAATVDFLSGQGRIPELIVVAVTNTDRTRDLTPTRADLVDEAERVFEAPTSGGASRFLDFFEGELFPWVESSYRTLPYRVFAGHSFGGLFALHAFTDRPDDFAAVIAVSPTLFWDNDLPLRRMRETLAAGRGRGKALYVTSGGEGPRVQRAFDELQTILRRSSVPGFHWGMRQWPEEDHGSVVLLSQYYGLEEVFDGWRFPVDPVTGRFTRSLDELEKHFAKWSRRFGATLLPPENLVNNLGYQYLNDGDTETALRAFRLNVERFPDSPNVHDSLGEGLERAGEKGEAASHYRRAVELGETTGDPNLEIYRRHLAGVTSGG